MAVYQPKTSYSDTTPQRRAIGDMIDVIDSSEVPGVKFFGLDGAPSKFRIVNWPSTKVEWLEDELAPLTDALNGSITSDATTITVVDGSKFKPGDVALIHAEYIWVSAANTSTNVITATRDFGGTQATHADAAVVTIVSNARLEGADADYGRAMVDIAAPYNYTQIFQDDVRVTRTQDKMSQYGIDNEYDYQVAKRFKEQLRLMNKSLYVGIRGAGSATTPRSMGGLETFITDNTSSLSSAALTQKALEDAIQSAWEDGGTPDTILCNGWVKRKISSFYAPHVRTERSEKRGGVMIDYVDTEFGTLQIVMDRWCPSSKLYIVSAEYVGFLAFEPFFDEELAKTGDSRKGQVVGEYTLVAKNDKAHALISSISTSS